MRFEYFEDETKPYEFYTTPIELELCSSDRFKENNKSFIAGRSFLCPKDLNFTLSGAYSSPQLKSLMFYITPCG
jgi:hypothetical protein